MNGIPVENIPASITRALDKICVELNYETYRYRFERGSNDGDGIISVLTRVHVDGQRNGKPEHKSFIAKYQSSDKGHREKFNSAKLFEREAFVYAHVLPEFEKIQAEFGISHDDGYFAYPKCYHASDGSNSDDEIILILEDLSARNFIMDRTTKVYRPEFARLVYEQLGRLHALSFVLRVYKPDVFAKFKQMDDILHTVMTTEVLQPISTKTIELIASILDPDEAELKQTILKYKTSLWDEMSTKVLNGNVAEPYSVVNHADCWLNNLMCRFENDVPTELILIDYQHTRYCSPAIDLINFTFSLAAHEIRTHDYEYFIDLYYKSLQTMLRQFGCDPDKIFPFHVLHAHLKRFGIIGFALGSFTIPINCGLDINDVATKNLPQYENFKIQMKRLIRDLNSLGYFNDAQHKRVSNETGK